MVISHEGYINLQNDYVAYDIALLKGGVVDYELTLISPLVVKPNLCVIQHLKYYYSFKNVENKHFWDFWEYLGHEPHFKIGYSSL